MSKNDDSQNLGEIDLGLISKLIIRNKKLIFSTTIFIFLISSIFSFFIPKTWKGGFQIVLNNNTIDPLDIIPGVSDLGIEIGQNNGSIKTEVGILESPSVLLPIYEFVKNEKDNKNPRNDLSYNKWKRNLNISLRNRTEILDISYKDKDKQIIIPTLTKISQEYQKYSGKSRKRGLELTLNYLNEQLSIFKDKSLKSFQELQEYAIDKDLVLDNISIILEQRKVGNSTPDLENRLLSNATFEGDRVDAANKIRKINFKLKEIENIEDFSKIKYLLSSIEPMPEFLVVDRLEQIEETIAFSKLKYTSNDPINQRLKIERDNLFQIVKSKLISILESERISEESRMKAAERPKDVIIKYKNLLRKAINDEKTILDLENKIRFSNLEKAKTKDPWELISKPTLVGSPVAPNKKMIIFASSLMGFIAATLIAWYKEKSSGYLYSENLLVSELGIDILEKINLINYKFQNFTIENFNKYVLKKNSSQAFLYIGEYPNEQLKKFINFIKEDKNNFQVYKNINEIKDDQEILILVELGKFKIQDLNSFNFQRIKLNKKFKGIIILES